MHPTSNPRQVTLRLPESLVFTLRVALVVAVVCNITLIAVIVSVLARRAVVGGPMPHAPHSN